MIEYARDVLKYSRFPASRPSILGRGSVVRRRSAFHLGTGWLGTVLDVVESRPRWLLAYWHTPPNICVNPLLENEEFLTLAVEAARRADHVGALIEPRWIGFSRLATRRYSTRSPSAS